MIYIAFGLGRGYKKMPLCDTNKSYDAMVLKSITGSVFVQERVDGVKEDNEPENQR
jgi:hypothetical protein